MIANNHEHRGLFSFSAFLFLGHLFPAEVNKTFVFEVDCNVIKYPQSLKLKEIVREDKGSRSYGELRRSLLPNCS